MKQKELKNLAKKIAKVELKLQETTDKEERMQLEEEMFALCGKANNIQEMSLLDDLVQEYLTDNKQ